MPSWISTPTAVAQNDRYAFVEEGLSGGTLTPDGNGWYTYTGPTPTLAQKQKGELVLGHVDCNTAPFLWNYADRFTLFDNFFDTVIGPSTPNAIAMLAGQSGVTQWVKHPELGSNNDTNNSALPVTGDPQPFWGSALDIFPGVGQTQPTESGGAPTTNPSSNLTFASLPLSFMGNQIQNITSQDALALDLAGCPERHQEDRRREQAASPLGLVRGRLRSGTDRHDRHRDAFHLHRAPRCSAVLRLRSQ